MEAVYPELVQTSDQHGQTGSDKPKDWNAARKACGYRDEEYLKPRIYNAHTSTYALTG